MHVYTQTSLSSSEGSLSKCSNLRILFGSTSCTSSQVLSSYVMELLVGGGWCLGGSDGAEGGGIGVVWELVMMLSVYW